MRRCCGVQVYEGLRGLKRTDLLCGVSCTPRYGDLLLPQESAPVSVSLSDRQPVSPKPRGIRHASTTVHNSETESRGKQSDPQRLTGAGLSGGEMMQKPCSYPVTSADRRPHELPAASIACRGR